jgi:Tfp pilus assembly protein PilX
MRFKDKRSKITGMRIRGLLRGQQGMASIVVVSVLIIIMTLISIGFARIVNRTAINSANKQSPKQRHRFAAQVQQV